MYKKKKKIFLFEELFDIFLLLLLMTKIIYFDLINHMNKSSVQRTKTNYEDKLWFLFKKIKYT